MKKHVSKFILGLVLTMSMGMTAFATSAPNLDDIVAGSSVQTEVTTNVVQENNSSIPEQEYTNRSFADSLGSAMDLSTETKVSADFSRTANYYGSIAFQWLAIIVSVGVLIMVALDMVFITLPFTRSFLANGYMGNPNASNPNGMQQGVAMNMNGMPMGGSRFGGSRYGGGGVFGGRGLMNNQAQMGQQTAMQNQPALGRMQYVSNAALNAITTESASNKLALIEYLKDMSVTIVLSSVILVLAGTGVLGTLGLAIGEKLTIFIKGIISSLA